MGVYNKHNETGSDPYHLNTNNTAVEISVYEVTNPENGFLTFLNKHIIINNEFDIIEMPVIQEYQITDE